MLFRLTIGDDGFQKRFVYQPTINMVYVRQVNNEYHIFAWKSNGIYNS